MAGCCVRGGNYSFGGASQGQTLDEIKAILEQMLEEMSNDDYFSEALWEAPNGTIVVKRVVRADDGSITTEYTNVDGTPYSGSTSALIPYSRNTIIDKVEYCANNVPFSRIEFRDHDTRLVVATIWRNDNDFSETTTAPSGAVKGGCVEADTTKVTYQPVDCTGANVGTPVDANNVKLVNASDIFCAIVSAVDSAKTAIVDAVNKANTDITAAINNSIAVLEDIKTELITANTTLTNIKSDTATINTKLDTVISKIDIMITSLASIDTKLDTTNSTLADILAEISTIGGDLADIKIAVESIDDKLDTVISSLDSIETKLDTLHTDLVGIQDTLNDILAELDYELIITAPTVNCADDNGTKVSFYTREKIVWDSEKGLQVSKVVEYSLDGEDFTASKPTGTVSIGACVTTGDITDVIVSFQPVDCAGANVGTPIDAMPVLPVGKGTVHICNVDDITDAINSKLDEVIQAIEDNAAPDYTAILTSVDTKLNELALIKAELITSNSKLTNIETNTNTTNTKLDTVISKLDDQIAELEGIKLSIDIGNIKLDEIFAKLEDILVSVDAIKVDIAEIKIDIEAIKTSVASIDNKLTAVVDSLTEIETKLDSVVSELQTINTTLQTEFDQTQVKLDEIKAAILAKGADCATATFTKDCDRVALLAKLDELKEVEYNINEQWRVTGANPPAPYDTDTTDGATYTFPAGTYHSWDIVVESGIVKIEIGGKIFSHKKGYSQSYDATTLYTNDIIVTEASDDCVATIVTIK